MRPGTVLVPWGACLAVQRDVVWEDAGRAGLFASAAPLEQLKGTDEARGALGKCSLHKWVRTPQRVSAKRTAHRFQSLLSAASTSRWTALHSTLPIALITSTLAMAAVLWITVENADHIVAHVGFGQFPLCLPTRAVVHVVFTNWPSCSTASGCECFLMSLAGAMPARAWSHP